MKLAQVYQNYKDFVMPTYNKTPLVFTKGKGSILWDMQGKKYLDFFPGWGVGNLGHCHPKVMQAVRDQISKLIFIPNSYYHLPQAKLAKELIYWSFPGKVFFCNSGAEANEAAIKLARKFGQGRNEIITFENAFHGRTLATLAATGQVKYQEGFQPMPAGFKNIKFNDLQLLKREINANTVALMLELVQGEGGINVADKNFVLALRKICDEHNLLLIIDEVQTGLGRTGKLFAYQQYGITPDIITLAKGLGGGLPIGAIVAKKEIADLLTAGMHASTFGGGPVICRAALAVLKATQEEKILANVNKMNEYLFKNLNVLKEKYPLIKDVRGIGLMVGIELNCEGSAIVQSCMEMGLLINCTHSCVLRMMPALNVNKKQIDQALVILENALRRA
ncbi:MAG: aspartate aminotransferase family protein [Candidatus Omnitrophica bacterium]|jgi:acetylornithine/N-succinyldiaminopimelate aminotransferase|nr:aspartate aminotransferase family protein [Candidatus Omnitrophota bacterium]